MLKNNSLIVYFNCIENKQKNGRFNQK